MSVAAYRGKWDPQRLGSNPTEVVEVEKFLAQHPGATLTRIVKETRVCRSHVAAILVLLVEQRRVRAVPNMGPLKGKGYRLDGSVAKIRQPVTAWSLLLNDDSTSPKAPAGGKRTQVMLELGSEDLKLLLATLEIIGRNRRAAWSDSAMDMWPDPDHVSHTIGELRRALAEGEDPAKP